MNCENFNSVGFGDYRMDSNGECQVIENLIQDGDIIFDIGANRGNYSYHILTTKKNVRLYSFEPIPFIFEHLQTKLSLFNVSCYNLALSNQTGIQDFFYYEEKKLTPSASELSGLFHRPIVDKICNYDATVIRVKTDTLDSFCSEHGISTINFLKIDTEGAELNVLEGATNLLATNAIKINSIRIWRHLC
jgi:FkbM family methyltransferase